MVVVWRALVAELIDQTFLVLQKGYLVVDPIEGGERILTNFIKMVY